MTADAEVAGPSISWKRTLNPTVSNQNDAKGKDGDDHDDDDDKKFGCNSRPIPKKKRTSLPLLSTSSSLVPSQSSNPSDSATNEQDAYFAEHAFSQTNLQGVLSLLSDKLDPRPSGGGCDLSWQACRAKGFGFRSKKDARDVFQLSIMEETNSLSLINNHRTSRRPMEWSLLVIECIRQSIKRERFEVFDAFLTYELRNDCSSLNMVQLVFHTWASRATRVLWAPLLKTDTERSLSRTATKTTAFLVVCGVAELIALLPDRRCYQQLVMAMKKKNTLDVRFDDCLYMVR